MGRRRALRQQPVTLLGSADGAARNRDQLATQLQVRVLRLGAGIQVWCRHAGAAWWTLTSGLRRRLPRMTTFCVSPGAPMLCPRPLVLALSLACTSALPLLPGSAHAQTATRTYDLPASRWRPRWTPTAG